MCSESKSFIPKVCRNVARLSIFSFNWTLVQETEVKISIPSIHVGHLVLGMVGEVFLIILTSQLACNYWVLWSLPASFRYYLLADN